MPALEETVRRYLATTNETDAGQRRALIEQVFTPDATYVEPFVGATGWDAIDQTVAAVQHQLPGLRFTLADGVDAHHDQVRFRWHLASPAAAEPLVVGFDVAVAERGRFQHVHRFLDKTPAAA